MCNVSFIFQQNPFDCSFCSDTGSKLLVGQGHSVRLSFLSAAPKSGSIWWKINRCSIIWAPRWPEALYKLLLKLPCYLAAAGTPSVTGPFPLLRLFPCRLSSAALIRAFLFLLGLIPTPAQTISHPPCGHPALFWGTSPGCVLGVDTQGGLCKRKQTSWEGW